MAINSNGTFVPGRGHWRFALLPLVVLALAIVLGVFSATPGGVAAPEPSGVPQANLAGKSAEAVKVQPQVEVLPTPTLVPTTMTPPPTQAVVVEEIVVTEAKPYTGTVEVREIVISPAPVRKVVVETEVVVEPRDPVVVEINWDLVEYYRYIGDPKDLEGFIEGLIVLVDENGYEFTTFENMSKVSRPLILVIEALSSWDPLEKDEELLNVFKLLDGRPVVLGLTTALGWSPELRELLLRVTDEGGEIALNGDSNAAFEYLRVSVAEEMKVSYEAIQEAFDVSPTTLLLPSGTRPESPEMWAEVEKYSIQTVVGWYPCQSCSEKYIVAICFNESVSDMLERIEGAMKE